MTDRETSGTLPERTWEPPLATAVVVFALTAGAVSVTAVWADRLLPVAIGAVGAISGALALRALTVERYRVAAIAAAGVLFVPVGICLTLAVAVTVLVPYRATFPVATPADIAGPALEITAGVIIVVGASVAVFGASTRGDGLTRATLGEAIRILIKLQAIPVIWTGGIGILTVLSTPGTPPSLNLLATVSDGVAFGRTVLLAPPAPAPVRSNGLAAELAVGTFALCLLLAVAGLRRLVVHLPIAAVLGATTAEADRIDAQVAQAESLLTSGRRVLVLVAVVVGGADAALSASRWLQYVDAGVMMPLWNLATIGVIRQLMVWLYLSSLVVGLAVWLIRRLAQTPAEAVVIPYLPFAIGGGTVALAYVIAPSVVPRGLDLMLTYLSELGEMVRPLATGVVDFYGPGLVLTGVVGMLLVLTLALLVVMYLVIRSRVMDDTTTGSTLAAVGLLVCAGFGAVTDLPFAVTVVVAVIGLVVGNLGPHGRGLGLEVGRLATTYRAEFGRLGYLSVTGVVAAPLAIGVHRTLATGLVTALPAALPLSLALVTIVLFVLLLWRR